MSVLANQRLRRKQLLCEAEGYLDLATVFADRWPLPVQLRDGLASVPWIRSAAQFDERMSRQGGLSRGQALRIMERHEDAVTALERSAESDPSNIHIWLAWAGATLHRPVGYGHSIAGKNVFHRRKSSDRVLQPGLLLEPRSQRQAPADYLGRAFEMDPAYRDLVAEERDFDPIRAGRGSSN